MDIAQLCAGCFKTLKQPNVCPACGYDPNAPRSPLALGPGTTLNEQFYIGRVLGKPGGFGITYLGWDLRLATRVAIKEYLPRDLAGRATDRATVAAHTNEDGELFRFGLEQFLREARTLAQLDHPNIVRVRQFFEANETAYLVMDYYDGMSFAEYLGEKGGRIDEAAATQLLLPILDGLRAIHAKGFLHRDIKPENIYLAQTSTGGVRPLLLDFGAARQAMSERSRSLSVVVTEGYAPFEQYHRSGNQGPWTDLYAAAAVLYRAVTGVVPPEATERRDEDKLQPATAYGVSAHLSDALGQALKVAVKDRLPSVTAFQSMLSPPATPPGPPLIRHTPRELREPRARGVAPSVWWMLVVAVVASLATAIWWHLQRLADDVAAPYVAMERTDTGLQDQEQSAARERREAEREAEQRQAAEAEAVRRAAEEKAERERRVAEFEAAVVEAERQLAADEHVERDINTNRESRSNVYGNTIIESPEASGISTSSRFNSDWGSGIQAFANNTPCNVIEFGAQGYRYDLSVTIPVARLKRTSDAWSVSDGRAETVKGCWSWKDGMLAQAKMQRKKDQKVWEQDLNFGDGSWFAVETGPSE